MCATSCYPLATILQANNCQFSILARARQLILPLYSHACNKSVHTCILAVSKDFLQSVSKDFLQSVSKDLLTASEQGSFAVSEQGSFAVSEQGSFGGQ